MHRVRLMPLAVSASTISSRTWGVNSLPPLKSQVSGLWQPGHLCGHPCVKNETETPGAALKSFLFRPANRMINHSNLDSKSTKNFYGCVFYPINKQIYNFLYSQDAPIKFENYFSIFSQDFLFYLTNKLLLALKKKHKTISDFLCNFLLFLF